MPGKKLAFEIDWAESVIGILKKHDPKEAIIEYKKLDNLKYSFEIDLTGQQGHHWKPADEKAFLKLVNARIKLGEEKAAKSYSSNVDAFFRSHTATAGGKLGFKAKGDHTKEVNALLFQIDQVLTKEGNKVVEYTDRTMHQYFKGKGRRGRLVAQGVKHLAKPVVSPVLFVVGASLSTNPFTLPAGILALKTAAQSVKDSVDFFTKKYRSTRDLEFSIKENLAYLLDKASEMEIIKDEMDQLVKDGKKDSPRHKWLYIQYRELELKAKNREAKAIIVKEFCSMHKKSIENLKLLVHKYKKKIEQLVYEYMHLGSKQAELEGVLSNLRDFRKRDKAFLSQLKKDLKNSNEDQIPGVIQQIGTVQKDLDFADRQIPIITAQIAALDNMMDRGNSELVSRQKLLRKMEKQVDMLRDGRSDDIHAFKKLIRFTNATFDLAGSAAGAGFDYAGPMGAAEKIVTAAGNALDAAENLNTGAQAVKQKLNK